MPRWMKIKLACAYAGDVSPRMIYEAVRSGELRAATVGRGRNLVFCEAWIDDWLERRAEEKRPREVTPARKMQLAKYESRGAAGPGRCRRAPCTESSVTGRLES